AGSSSGIWKNVSKGGMESQGDRRMDPILGRHCAAMRPPIADETLLIYIRIVFHKRSIESLVKQPRTAIPIAM
ncbi:MAG: hypothetical protein KDH18_20385, partial [Rhodoferax sp.]|nr:hypothetical protein [Rhodoferax sp.]